MYYRINQIINFHVNYMLQKHQQHEEILVVIWHKKSLVMHSVYGEWKVTGVLVDKCDFIEKVTISGGYFKTSCI